MRLMIVVDRLETLSFSMNSLPFSFLSLSPPIFIHFHFFLSLVLAVSQLVCDEKSKSIKTKQNFMKQNEINNSLKIPTDMKQMIDLFHQRLSSPVHSQQIILIIFIVFITNRRMYQKNWK